MNVKSTKAIEQHLRESSGASPSTSTLGRLARSGRQALRLRSLLASARDGRVDTEALTELVAGFGEMKGIAMKAGQMLGYLDASMPEELRQALALLQRNAQPSEWTVIEQTLRTSLSERATALLTAIERTPVAVASIGQVHRATVDGTRAVAVKVQHPSVRATIEADFRAAAIGSVIAAATATPAIGESIDEAREAFEAECDYGREARWQERFAACFAGDRDIIVPAVLRDFCTENVLVTDWIESVGLERWIETNPAQSERNRVGAALYRFWIRTLYRDGLFHADPHPGNIGVCPDGRVVIFDYGCVREFSAEQRSAFAALARAVRSEDDAAVLEALAQMGATIPSDAKAKALSVGVVRAFFAPMLRRGVRTIEPDAGMDVREALSNKRIAMQLALPARFLFLFRLRFGLMAVLSRLGAALDWSALESSWASETTASTAGAQAR